MKKTPSIELKEKFPLQVSTHRPQFRLKPPGDKDMPLGLSAITPIYPRKTKEFIRETCG
jgi:hypothetical protein